MTSELGKHYDDGEVIVRQGELGDCMYVIQEGEVEVIQRHGDKEFCLSVLKAGDFFGEMALLEKEVRPATVRAVGNACVLLLEKRTFLHRMHEDASFAFRIIKKMAHRIRQLEMALVRTADIGTIEAALFAAGSYAQQPPQVRVPEPAPLPKP
jgi:CRP/FNR family transcriptional regulator, cyclic AMP receptor protein